MSRSLRYKTSAAVSNSLKTDAVIIICDYSRKEADQALLNALTEDNHLCPSSFALRTREITNAGASLAINAFKREDLFKRQTDCVALRFSRKARVAADSDTDPV